MLVALGAEAADVFHERVAIVVAVAPRPLRVGRAERGIKQIVRPAARAEGGFFEAGVVDRDRRGVEDRYSEKDGHRSQGTGP